MTLFGTGSGAREGDRRIPREEAVRVIEKEWGKLPLAALLRCRVRYFTDGLIFRLDRVCAGGGRRILRQPGQKPVSPLRGGLAGSSGGQRIPRPVLE